MSRVPTRLNNVALNPTPRETSTAINYLLGRRIAVSASDFGAAGDYNPGTGTGTNDTAAFKAAIASLGSAGGTVIVNDGMRCLIDSGLTVPDNVTIEGVGNGRWGKYNNVESTMLGWAPALYVNPAVTITVNSSAGLRNIAVFRKGLQFNITSAQVAAQFTGAAITFADFACDPLVENCTILGFQYAIRTVAANTRANRCHIKGNNIDCLNGIFLENAADLSFIRDNEGWPFITVGSTVETNNAQLIRSGTFLHLGGTINDWSTGDGNFCYGYMVGYRATDSVTSCDFVNCGADHVPGLTDGAVGILVDGNAKEISAINPRVAAKQYGVKVDSGFGTGTRVVLMLVNPKIWSTTTAAILNVRGDLDINGGYLRGGASGVKTSTGSGWTKITGADIRGFTTALDNFSTSIVLQHHNCTFSSNTAIASNPYTPTVPSGASIVLDGDNDNFTVTGTTNCGTLSPVAGYAGRRVTLKFTSALQMLVGGNLKLAGGVNFSATADDTLTLYSDGSNWFEVSRSAN